jgi:GNAT superfamily N-acetyltransferase
MADFYGRDDISFTIGSDEFNGITRDQNGNVRPVVTRSFSNFSRISIPIRIARSPRGVDAIPLADAGAASVRPDPYSNWAVISPRSGRGCAMDAEELVIEAEHPRAAEAALLIELLSAELGQRYGDDGDGHFRPEDVCVPGGVFLVARLGSVPVGCGALRPITSETGEIKRMFVEPAYRGRGFSRRILAELERRAAEFGYRAVRLETGTVQHEALRLYETSGYHRIECYGYHKDDPRSVCFEKKL